MHSCTFFQKMIAQQIGHSLGMWNDYASKHGGGDNKDAATSCNQENGIMSYYPVYEPITAPLPPGK